MALEQPALQQVKRKLKMHLVDLLDTYSELERRQLLGSREAMATQLRRALSHSPDEFHVDTLTTDDQQRLINDLVDEIAGLGPLETLLTDPAISEIMINGPHEIFIEKEGRVYLIEDKFKDSSHLMTVIERMLGQVHLSVNEASPICDASLPDGARINVIIPPLVLNGPVVTIRRKLRDWSVDDYLSKGSLTKEAAEFLEGCIKAKVNMIISGGTSTGKTTLVSILSRFIPPEERLITIENVPELELPYSKHWIRVVGRQGNIEGRGEVPLRTLVKNALRMRPDRIILGEARGGEALDVVQAMHSVHDGFITVLHANNPRAALERLETLMLMSGLDIPLHACRTQIARATDLVIHLTRFVDGNRGIESILQVTDATTTGFVAEELFHFQLDAAEQGVLRYTGVTPNFLRKFHMHHVPIPSWIDQGTGTQRSEAPS